MTTTAIASWISSLLPASSSLTRGFVSSSLAVLLTIVLELASFPHVQKMLALKGGRELYRSAIWTNVRNNLLLGPLTYYLTIEHVCSSSAATPPPTILDRSVSVAGILIIEGALYYYVHKCFHEVKSLYWIHRYHHKFNTVVLPSSANAVSVAEYVFAYMIPIVIGVAVMRADELSSFLAAAVIGVTNLIIHTPGWWEESTHKHYHWIFVSTRDHLNHHRKNEKGNYGAPVLHLDRIHAAVGAST